MTSFKEKIVLLLELFSNSIFIHIFFADGNETWKGPFMFIQAADTQLGLIERYVEKKPSPKWDVEIELTRKAILKANEMSPKPKFFIVCGDLVDAFPGTKDREAQECDLKTVFKDLSNDIPLVCVCGNHDVGDTPTPESIEKYRKSYGRDFFAFYVSGVIMIVINSQYYEDRTQVDMYAQEQDVWLDKILAEVKSGNYKHAIVFQHIPWFINEPNEEKQYFNIEIELRHKMLNKFYDAGIRSIFCGHYHRNAGGLFKDMQQVVTSAVGAQLGDDKSGLRVVKVLDTSVEHQYFALDDVPKSVHF